MSSTEDGSDVWGSSMSLQSRIGRGHPTNTSEWGLGGRPSRRGTWREGFCCPKMPTAPPRKQSDPPPDLPSPDPSPPPSPLSKPPPPTASAHGSLSSPLPRFFFHTQTLSNAINRKKEVLNRKEVSHLHPRCLSLQPLHANRKRGAALFKSGKRVFREVK